MARYKLITDPYGELMTVDLDTPMVVTVSQNWCSTCQANVSFVGGRWTYWLSEPDKWHCELHK
jgi:hypothetical protein